MFVGAALLLAVLAGLFAAFDVPGVVAVGFLPIVAIFLVVGVRNIYLARSDAPAARAETVAMYHRVGSEAFWTLMGLVLLDIAFDITPPGLTRSAYLYIGGISFLVYFVYYRYVRQTG